MLEKLYELLPKNDLDFEYIINGILKPYKEDLKNTHQELLH